MADSELPDLTETTSLASTDILYVVKDPGGGGEADRKIAAHNLLWTKTIDEDGSSFTNFTSIAGTWASSGGIISDTSTASSQEGAYHATKIESAGIAVAQCDVRLPSSGQAAGDLFGGISLFTTTGVSSVPGHRMLLARVAGTRRVDIYYGTIAGSITPLGSATWSLDTWYTLRIVARGNYGAYYLDGTFLGTVLLDGAGDKAVAERVQLTNFGAKVDYRNLKVWEFASGLLPS